jgi:hypothetical protein
MMWNWIVSALACEATVVLIDGSPAAPDLERLWHLVDRAGITHFGTSPKYLAGCEGAGLRPRDVADLSSLRAIMSTGSPLHARQFDYVYDAVHPDVQLASISGGTDLVSLFAGGVPTLPVRRGELQARTLGMAVEAWKDGAPVVGEPGELVCTRPFVSMPVGFWGDEDGSRYRDAYFADHPGVWTHGDLIEITPEGGVIISGRSDTTLNPGGVRIGTAELYRAVEPLPEVEDVIACDRQSDGDTEIVLFVQLAEGADLTDDLRATIRDAIRQANTPRHVPRHIVAVSAIPYTRSGKKTEKAVRRRSPLDHPDRFESTGHAAPAGRVIAVAWSFGEERELVAVRVEQEELPATGAVLARLAGRGEPVSEHSTVEVVDVVDLEIQRRSGSGLDVSAVVVGGEGHPEPVDVARDLAVISLAEPETERFVELGRLVEITRWVDEAGDAADLHGVLHARWCPVVST